MMNDDDEFKHQIMLEQYRQAAEEYRAEDRNTWQTFAIILALNGALVGFLNFDNTTQFSLSVLLSAIIGIVSVYADICIIGRTRLYQKQRIHIAEKIQTYTDIRLYFDDKIENIIKSEFPSYNIKWDERGGGRKMMKIILIIIDTMWFVLGTIGILGIILKIINQYSIIWILGGILLCLN